MSVSSRRPLVLNDGVWIVVIVPFGDECLSAGTLCNRKREAAPAVLCVRFIGMDSKIGAGACSATKPVLAKSGG